MDAQTSQAIADLGTKCAQLRADIDAASAVLNELQPELTSLGMRQINQDARLAKIELRLGIVTIPSSPKAPTLGGADELARTLTESGQYQKAAQVEAKQAEAKQAEAKPETAAPSLDAYGTPIQVGDQVHLIFQEGVTGTVKAFGFITGVLLTHLSDNTEDPNKGEWYVLNQVQKVQDPNSETLAVHNWNEAQADITHVPFGG